MNILPALPLPKCGDPATVQIEIWSARPGSPRPSFDGTTYTCHRHADTVEQALTGSGVSPDRDPKPYRQMPGEVVAAVCGTLRQLPPLHGDHAPAATTRGAR